MSIRSFINRATEERRQRLVLGRIVAEILAAGLAGSLECVDGKAEEGAMLFIPSLRILKWISSGPLLKFGVALASRIAWRSDPTPLSFVFVTEKTLMSATSKAPISQVSPCGRATPRWSVVVHVLLSPASMAGLPAKSAIVSV